MESFFDGATFKVIKDEAHATTREQAEAFVLYGTLAEIFARDTGFNRGLGGSMHAFFIPFGSMPNNALVGGSADIAVGSALFKMINRNPAWSLPTSAMLHSVVDPFGKVSPLHQWINLTISGTTHLAAHPFSSTS